MAPKKKAAPVEVAPPAPPMEPLTGYEVCVAMVALIDAQRAKTLAKLEMDAESQKGIVAEIHNLARSSAVVQAELRKTHDDAARSLKAFPLERQVELILGMVKKLPPEYRQAIGAYVAELGGGLLT